ncbi:MarR family winged helix-turn-helix transcriptional regulator [Variovorax sp. Varisp41]|uniref:MarR family winged helix-turn-helix transcriptional regulator n=1 Tax=Variovorax sp. Varisp41 TaxID=3243033 RepID=UPI0039B44F0C
MNFDIGLMSYERVTAEMSKAAPGITSEQVQTFIAVARGVRCSQIEISKITGFSRQATSRHVAKLVSVGLLVQHRDPENRRRRVVRLTALGRLVPASLRYPSKTFNAP